MIILILRILECIINQFKLLNVVEKKTIPLFLINTPLTSRYL